MTIIMTKVHSLLPQKSHSSLYTAQLLRLLMNVVEERREGEEGMALRTQKPFWAFIMTHLTNIYSFG